MTHRGPWRPEERHLWVTLYTDAGWKAGRARLGFIARGALEPKWLKGSLTVEAPHSTAAEAHAVLFGVVRVLEVFQPPEGERLRGCYLRVDCQALVPTIQRFYRDGTLPGDKLGEALTLAESHGFHLWAKHVRAHGRAKTSKQRWMNGMADHFGNMRGR